MSKITITLQSILQAWQKSNLMLRILIGIIIGAVLALTIPGHSIIAILGDLYVLKLLMRLCTCGIIPQRSTRTIRYTRRSGRPSMWRLFNTPRLATFTSSRLTPQRIRASRLLTAPEEDTNEYILILHLPSGWHRKVLP